MSSQTEEPVPSCLQRLGCLLLIVGSFVYLACAVGLFRWLLRGMGVME